MSKLTSDFDFLNGHFDVAHRQLRKPLSGSDEWDEYAGTCSARTHFDGAISLDEMQFPTKGSYGLSLRLFDPQTEEWSIYWVNSTSYEVFPPVRGKWADGSCWLVGEDTYDGRPILASYSWSDITATSAHWEQSFSEDGGETWEVNWTMDFTRRETAPPAPGAAKVTGDFDFLVGSWDMHNRRRRPALGDPAEWYELESKMQVWSYFDGAISFDEGWFPSLNFQGATFRVFNPATGQWSIHWVNSQRGQLETPVVGSFTDGIGIFEGPDVWEGQEIDVRFRWTPGDQQASWQQSFSTDGGETWVPNWEMTHTRTS
ncbi:hypothetical protein [Kribbella sp. NPDC051770]|uniref:hypothetical protein n=1 Tax=Kribbella sp. NPDC051770 TaxID=3155413 RepID=UPI003429CDC1